MLTLIGESGMLKLVVVVRAAALSGKAQAPTFAQPLQRLWNLLAPLLQLGHRGAYTHKGRCPVKKQTVRIIYVYHTVFMCMYICAYE